MGLAAFRLDASRHMWSGDLQAVSDKLHNLSSKWSHLFPGGEPIQVSEYFGLGSVTEFKSSAKLGIVVCRWDKEKLSYLKSWEEGWALMPTVKALVFVDNHGAMVLRSRWRGACQKMATGLVLAHPYGLTRVMSSYCWHWRFKNEKVSMYDNTDYNQKCSAINTSLCDWISNFLTDRPQSVWVGNCVSSTLNLSPGAPQGCVLSLLLYSLYTYDCTATSSSTIIVKFADDTVVMGLISGNDERAYLEEIKHLENWCQENNLLLNVSKRKELIMDCSKKQEQHYQPVRISGTMVERVDSFRNLGVHISQDLS
ncbi:hypothetical protein P4O66_011991 [Electrophorus voltai]|uniref:Reverse transcriptase domain-containing protein n=1 Tax=Electrophorus voltai TaxID=2609070 RepID=A0AAD9DUG6_9TELE|nr:hypothetical protein P4O66_011991 [Electrophorus voltai]